MASGIIVWFLMMTTLKLNPLLVKGEQQVPCLFIIGDSTYDNGNNNNLLTAAKANYPPYGIDFPDGPTGRFTNGRNIADFIAELLGFDKYIEPFATVKGVEMFRGVNYASGAAGILDESGIHLGDRISLNRQLRNHKVTISHMSTLLGNNKTLTKEYLSKCIYIVGMGNNDYINNYLLPQFYPSSHLYKPEKYATILVQQYEKQLKTLYRYGARKVAVFGLGGIGCIPAELDLYGTKDSGCVDSINKAVQYFDDKLIPMINDLNSNLPNTKFIYVNSTSIGIGDPSSIGITNLLDPCCEMSSTIANGQCKYGGGACSDRASHYFWDGFHPTETPNKVTATRAYSTLLPTDAYPFDISHLALL
ncbi:GDSL esterase/lipase At1g29670 [Nicotiana tabacum]|uniref:GDSL esterase/lipase At1g29670 n=1 Tax=Nicotiana tabacum TaxID=4097 RepID=A0A1S3XHA6_TOBAC|nr:GDSL esterase/lipase At1g29670-like [Nicotiana tomentosiformis]XP_016439311.1 PREDICTED: GDSL esterase/lipase At1g29670-like [Nicotiana tabacum]